MGYQERKSYFFAILLHYVNASRSEKIKILDEFCAVCDYSRKYAIRLLKKGPTQQKRKSGPKPSYNELSFIEVLKRIWFAADQPCSRRLKVIVGFWSPSYESTYGALQPAVKQKLLSISPATIDRLLKPICSTNNGREFINHALHDYFLAIG